MDENPKNSHLKKTHTRHTVRWIALILILITPSAIADSASLTVNSLADTRAVDGNCTLREAIENANNNAATNVDCTAGNGADTITFSVSGTITLSSALPTIRDAAGLTIDGTGQTVTISGANAMRVLYAGNTLILNHLTIANGYSTGGYVGGGVYHCCSGTLTITNSTFSGNTVSWEGRGGGIYNYWGTLTIINSTFSDNSVNDTGGGIYNNNAELIIANSTFTGNHATWGGGGIFNNGGTLSMTNSTIHGNSANFYSGGLMNTSNATGTLRNTIVANNTGGNCSGAFTNGGHNIDDGTTCNWGSASGSMSSINPMLGALIGSPAYFPLDA
jgi:CSLREA domain-containing protein